MLNYIMLAAVLAITLFMASKSHGLQVQIGRPEIAIQNWYMNEEIAYVSPEIVRRGVEIAEQVYKQNVVNGGMLTIVMAPWGILQSGILAYYDYRFQMIVINPEKWQELDSNYRIYLIAHEAGHHFMKGEDVEDHCLMYMGDFDEDSEGYDIRVLQLLGIGSADWYNYVDPFTAMYACGGGDY